MFSCTEPVRSTAKILDRIVAPEVKIVLLGLTIDAITIDDPQAARVAKVAQEKIEREQSKSIHAQNKHNQQKLFISKNPKKISTIINRDHRQQDGNSNHYKHRR
jgi:hypothetical protein